MILHLLFDDKFADYVINQFKSIGNSTYALVSYGKQVKYVSLLEEIKIYDILESNTFSLLLNEINKYNAVIFHGLFYPWQEELLKKIPSTIKKAWYFWGAEIYGRSDINKSFLAPVSKIFYRLYKYVKKTTPVYSIPKELFKSIDYCLTSVEEEYELSKKYFNADYKFLWYTCYNIEETIGKSLINSKCQGDDIWIGNAATIENNYFDILLKLKTIDIKNRKIIVPLSYGMPWVRNWCNKLGRLLYRNNFSPLITFLPREEYNQRMLSCSIMIQPHWRPNAHGNIITGLWLGMRVFLSERSIEYIFFKRLGIYVYSIEKDLNSRMFSIKLSDEQIKINRRILAEKYSNEQVLTRVKYLVDILD